MPLYTQPAIKVTLLIATGNRHDGSRGTIFCKCLSEFDVAIFYNRVNGSYSEVLISMKRSAI